MPSFEHEALLLLFRSDPRLAAEVLRASFDIRLPEGDARPVEASLGDIAPTDYRADLVVAIGEARVIVEVQLRRDDDKRWTWPHYVTALRARDRCEVLLLVVTSSDEVATWARAPIDLGPPGSWYAPLVIGPGFLTITDPETARRLPELAVLSVALRRGAKANLEAVHAAVTAVLGLAPDLENLYIDLILRSLGDEAQQVLEALMSISPGKYEYQSEFARKYLRQGREEGLEAGREEGLEAGREEGLEAGREEGLEAGREEGLEAGRVETMIHAILTNLSVRGLQVSGEQRAAILAASDLTMLDRWLRLSVTAPNVEEIFRRAPQSDA